MADHPINILLRARDQASKVIRGVNGELSKTGKIAGIAGKGLQTTGRNLAGISAVGLAGVGLAVKGGLQDLALLESATTSVDGAVQQLGLTGKISGAQVAGWANEIETSVGAAFDDKDITSATATLLRFGKVTPKNLRPAMVVMTDLATKTGSVDSAAALLAKALADPEKAAGKLARSGVILTKQQQAQIKAFMKAGKVAEAQNVIIQSLAKTTGGAALASQGKYQRTLSTLTDVSEDARKALAEGFLPVIEKVAGMLSKGVSDPKTMASIREFGQGLAKGLDSLITIAQKLPWAQIGDSLKIAGAGGKAVLDAFTQLPSWVQSAVLTGWGLNKLSGGALTGIAGELGKGLIKGVLGMTAGVVNLKAGVVNGGGVPGGGTTGGVGGALQTGATIAAGATAGVAIAQGFKELGGEVARVLAGGNKSMESTLNTGFDTIRTAAFGPFEQLRGLPEKIASLPSEISKAINGGEVVTKLQAQEALASDTRSEQIATNRGIAEMKTKQAASIVAFRAGERATQTGTANVAAATRTGTAGITASTNVGTSRIVGAIAANRAQVTTNVKVYVTGATVSRVIDTSNRYGNTNGSGGSGSNGASRPT